MNGQYFADYGMALASILQKVYDTRFLISQVRSDMLRAKFGLVSGIQY